MVLQIVKCIKMRITGWGKKHRDVNERMCKSKCVLALLNTIITPPPLYKQKEQAGPDICHSASRWHSSLTAPPWA